MNLAGFALVVLGILALVAGLAGGVAQLFRGRAVPTPQAAPLPTDFVKALTELLRALTQAPTWLALVVVGIALIVLGASL